MEISKERYEELLDCEQQLLALQDGGVDDWEWYGDSMKQYRRWKEQQEEKK